MLSYIIQVILFQTLFLAVYDIFLSRETFFSKNRFYLILSAIVSFILPLIKLPVIKDAVPQEYTILLPEVVLSPQSIIEKQEWYQSIDYLHVLFWFGVVTGILFFLVKLYSIIKLLLKNNVQKKEGYKLIILSNSTKAFSFFNFIFIGENIPKERKDKIIQHELVHARQKHTLDLLFFELLKICMWFNPILWVFQKRITTIHEFLSDEIASKSSETKTYINSLLEQVFQVEKISFVNQFYKNSLLKKRIIMMTKKRSKKNKQLKYLLLVPVLLSMLLYTACSENDTNLHQQETVSEEKGKLPFPPPPPPPVADSKNLMDIFLGKNPPNSKEYDFKDLSEEEKDEFLKRKNSFKDVGEDLKLRVFEGENGRKVLFVDMLKIIRKPTKSNKPDYGDMIPFSILDESPSFVGKEKGKESFNANIRDYIQENFDVKFANSLGLEPGRKRIYVQFRIDKEGNVIKVDARAPNTELKEYAINLVKKLPKMIPGKHEGKTVKVGYTLPITFEIK
ncbi:M56 family metallopeptidase [Tenacibaculum sp. MEBiC06402]|uniref:M56 family metallopeptidase n=1 Tax=unclassified Tenacibaculum TaxID=2635139 RepID=UPI003B9D0229